MDDIRVELGVPTQSPFSLDAARAGTYVALNTNSPTLPPSTGQVSLSSWYEYCQTCDTYYFSYASTSATACLNNDPIQIISNTIPIAVGSILTLPNGGNVFSPYYYSDGTNWYYVDGNMSEQTEVMSTGACASLAEFYISNSSLDVIINDVQVNGVSLTGVTGVGFPLSTGDSINGYSNQIGTYDVDIFYSLGVAGQHIEGTDCASNFFCNATVGTGGGKVTQFGGAAVNTSATFSIYAYDGSC